MRGAGRAGDARLASAVFFADDDFAYLHDWGEIGVVGDVSHDLFRVRAEAGLKPFHRVAKDVAHADVRSWGLPGSPPARPLSAV
jgi:hypothetical protein